MISTSSPVESRVISFHRNASTVLISHMVGHFNTLYSPVTHINRLIYTNGIFVMKLAMSWHRGEGGTLHGIESHGIESHGIEVKAYK